MAKGVRGEAPPADGLRSAFSHRRHISFDAGVDRAEAEGALSARVQRAPRCSEEHSTANGANPGEDFRRVAGEERSLEGDKSSGALSAAGGAREAAPAAGAADAPRRVFTHRRHISFDAAVDRAEAERSAARSARSHRMVHTGGSSSGAGEQPRRRPVEAGSGSAGGGSVSGGGEVPAFAAGGPFQPPERVPERGEGGENRLQLQEAQRRGNGGPEGPNAAAAAAATGNPAAVPLSNDTFFVKYTYSNECALLAYNFHEQVTKLGIFEHFAYRHDHRLISVTLAYMFYRYQAHHCDMALDLALTLVYLEDVRSSPQTTWREHNRDAFNLICYLAFLAHTFNADRTIRLSDWYKEIGWRSFQNCQQLNSYVFFLFSTVRGFRLRVSDTRVKRYIQKLCTMPHCGQPQRGSER